MNVVHRGLRRAACAAAMAALAALPAAPLHAAPPRFVPPAPVTSTLDNGLTLAVFQDARAAMVQVQLLIPAGMAAEGPGEEGLANFTAQLVRRGTASRSGAVFARDLAELGATWSASAQRDYTVHAIALRSADLDDGLAHFASAIRQPGFVESEIGRTQFEVTRALMELHLNVAATADEQAWPAALAEHPYGRALGGTVPSVLRLGRNGLERFHSRYYRPGGAVLAFAGDITPARATELARAHFGAWSGRAESVPALALARGASHARVRIVDLPSEGRSDVRVMVRAPERGSGDYLPFATLTRILGDGPSARLGRGGPPPGSVGPVRHAYSALRDAGLLTLGGGARTDSAGAMVADLRARLLALATEPPTEAELDRARTLAVRAHPFTIETYAGLLATWADAQHYGPAGPALEGFAAAGDTLTPAALARTARGWLLPEQVSVLAVGPADRLRPQLEAFGEVEVITLDGVPEESWATDEPTREDYDRGRAIVERSLAAHGGAKLIGGIRDSNVEYNVSANVDGNEVKGRVRQLRKEPLKYRETTEIFIYETVVVMDGDRGWISNSNEERVQVADSTQIAQMRASFVSDVPHLLLIANERTSRAAHRGREDVNGREADVVEVVSADGHRRWLLFDAESSLLVAFDVRGGIPPQVLARRVFADYRKVKGVQFPHREERYAQGRRTLQMEVQAVLLNNGIDDAYFRPLGVTR